MDILHTGNNERCRISTFHLSFRLVVTPHRYDHIPLFSPAIDVTVSLGDLLEGVTPINDRLEIASRRQGRQETQILCAFACRSGNDLLAARQRHPWDRKHGWQTGKNQKKSSTRLERLLATGEWRCSRSIDDDVVDLTVPRKILSRIIDDMISPQGPHKLSIRRTAYTRNHRAKVFRELNHGASDSPGSTVDKNPFSGLQIPFPQKIQRRRTTERERNSIMVAQARRDQRNCPVFFHAFVLGMARHTATADRKDTVPHFEATYTLPDCLNLTGNLHSQNRIAGPQYSEDQTCDNPETRGHRETSQPPVR